MAIQLPRTINGTQMRYVNRSAVLELVRQDSPIARSQIARRLGLSLPTVMRIIDELIAEDYVRETGHKEWSGGRQRQQLEFNKGGSAVIGVDLGGTKMYGGLANIGGEILSEETLNGHGTTGEDSYEMLSSLIERLLNLPRPDAKPVRGIAVGVPGITHSGGVVEWAPSLGWRDFPLQESLQRRFRLPVIAENDLNLAVLGEHWFGSGQGVSNMVLIAIGTGVGAGIIIDGALYRGHTESSGEIGYLVPSVQALGRTYDEFGALESIISGTGIAERARTMLAGQRATEELATLSANDVFEAARQHEDWACRLVEETVDYLAMAIADVSTLFDPELIVLSGGVSQAADQLLPGVLRRVQGVVPRLPRLEVSRLGHRAAIMGAIVIILHSTAEYYSIRRFS